MKSHHTKALVVVFCFCSALYFFFQYKDYFSWEKELPASIKVLETMKKEGVPLFSKETIYGKPFSLSQHKGQVILVNFWASTCAPCLKEFPSFLKLLRHFKGKIILVAISTDRNKESIFKFVKRYKMPKDVYVIWDKDKSLRKAYVLNALPETYIVKKDLKLFRKVVGFEDWFTKESLAFFKSLVL